MKHGSLFSGIGGFDLAASWMGWENVFHCENNEFCQKVLKHHFPKSICYGDIKTTDFSQWNGRCDIVTGGFPCQPFSVGGIRKGKTDPRYLWQEMLRSIIEIKPEFVVCENVVGLLSLENIYSEILFSLENEGYKTEAYIIPACSIGAIHKRERLWLLAYPKHNGYERGIGKNIKRENELSEIFFAQYETGNFHEIEEKFISEPRRIKNYDGVPRKLVKRELIAYGNAIVPQVAYEIFKAINECQPKAVPKTKEI